MATTDSRYITTNESEFPPQRGRTRQSLDTCAASLGQAVHPIEARFLASGLRDEDSSDVAHVLQQLEAGFCSCLAASSRPGRGRDVPDVASRVAEYLA